MKINKSFAIVVIVFGLLAGGLVAGILFSRQPLPVDAASPAQQDPGCVDDDQNVETDNPEDSGCDDEADDADEPGDVDEGDDGEDDDANEADGADEANTSPDKAGITADEARAAAEAAYAGTKAVEVELERENGLLMYEVRLDNGLEVIVDAANGDIIGTEQD
jgi:uncharacterized membrane protein YkoI